MAEVAEHQDEPADRSGSPTMRFRFGGRHLYASMIGLFGAIWLLSGNFVDIWQPVSDNFPERQEVV